MRHLHALEFPLADMEGIVTQKPPDLTAYAEQPPALGRWGLLKLPWQPHVDRVENDVLFCSCSQSSM